MSQNLISLSFSAADLADIDAALNTLEQKFSRLLGLSPDDRRKLSKMGDKSEAFCRQTFVLLSQNPGVIPPNFDFAEAQRDLANVDTLRPRFARLNQMAERADDSAMALGSDMMTAALEGYALLKVSGKAQGLDSLKQHISARFNHSSRPAAAAGPHEAGAAAA